jgi:hypothetical protein
MRMPYEPRDRFLQRAGIAPRKQASGRRLRCEPQRPSEAQIMGKYVLGWFLGVPLIVLVAVYFFAG